MRLEILTRFWRLTVTAVKDYFHPERHLKAEHKESFETYERSVVQGYVSVAAFMCIFMFPCFHIFVDRMTLGNSGIKWILSRGTVTVLAIITLYYLNSDHYKKIKYFRPVTFPLLLGVSLSVTLANLWESDYIFAHNFYYPVIAALLPGYSFRKTYLCYVGISIIQYPLLTMIEKPGGGYYTGFEIGIEYLVPHILIALIKTSHIRMVKKFIAEFEVKKLQGQVVKSEKEGAISQFACYLTHEVNSPLLVILNAAKKLKKMHLDSGDMKSIQNIDRISRNTDRIREVLDTVHVLTQRNQNLPTKQYRVDECFDLLGKSLEQEGLRLEFKDKSSGEHFSSKQGQVGFAFHKLIERLMFEFDDSEEKYIHLQATVNEKYLYFRFSLPYKTISHHLASEVRKTAFDFKSSEIGKGLHLDVIKLIIEENDGKMLLDQETNDIIVYFYVSKANSKLAA